MTNQGCLVTIHNTFLVRCSCRSWATVRAILRVLFDTSHFYAPSADNGKQSQRELNLQIPTASVTGDCIKAHGWYVWQMSHWTSSSCYARAGRPAERRLQHSRTESGCWPFSFILVLIEVQTHTESALDLWEIAWWVNTVICATDWPCFNISLMSFWTFFFVNHYY